MKMFLLALSLVATLNQPILFLNSGSDYNPTSFWDLGYDLNYIIDHFFTGVDKGLDIIDDFADTVRKLGIDDSPNIQVTPSVKYYNQPNTYTQNHTDYYDYKSYTTNYDNRSYSTTYNFDNRTYTYNPVYNDYRTYDYITYNDYNYFEDNDYYYITHNNITNYEFYIVNKIDVNENRYYSYYYELPSGSKSFNLTKEQVLGEFMSYDIYQYESVPDDDSLLGLWHFDGNYSNEVQDSIYSLSYNGNDFVNAHFNGGILLNGSQDMTISGSLPAQYTIEFWFYNLINNGTNSSSGAPFAWHHVVRTYDNGAVRGWIDGVEVTIGSTPCTYINNVTFTNKANTSDLSAYTEAPRPNSMNKGFLGSTQLPSRNLTVSDLNLYCNSASYSRIVNKGDYSYYTYYNGNVVLDSSYFDSNSPLHYYPLCTDNSILFGFTGVGADTLPCLNLNIGYYITQQPYSTRSYDVFTTCNIESVSTGTVTLNYCDMSQCIIDEMRLSEGLLYTNNFSVPQDPFEFGHIWERPSGDDFNIGDVAIQTDIPITDYRIGGADYSFPSTGNVYIGLNSNVGLYAKIYNGQSWIPCEFGVWNGTGWANGVGFNFSTLTWGTKNTDINIDVNISTDVNVTETDKKGFTDIVGFIFELFAFIPLCIGFLTIIPTPINIILIGLMGLLAVLIVLKIIKR